MINIGKTVGMIALSALLVHNTALANTCGSNARPRHTAYKPYQNGKYAQYYSALSHYYTQYAIEKSNTSDYADVTKEFYNKAARAQRGKVNISRPSPSNSDCRELENAYKMLKKHSTRKNMGMYPRQLAAAQFYYETWITKSKHGLNTMNDRTNFYKYINIVINNELNEGNDLSISQSRNIDRYLTERQLVGIIYFPFDNHTTMLNTDKWAIVDEVRMIYGKNYDIIVVGHADKVGTKNYNIDLSVKRAKAVKELLVKSGVAVEGVDIIAYGESKVSKDYGTVTYDNSANRRVEIYAVKKQQECN